MQPSIVAADSLRNAAATLAAVGSASAQSRRKLPTVAPGTNTSFGAIKQVDAGLLNVGYAQAGPAGCPAVVLLHGWPYDIHRYIDVAPMLASAGSRVIVPYLEATEDEFPFQRYVPQCPAIGGG